MVLLFCITSSLCFFFFNDTATTEIYTLSLHDALPIPTSTRASSVRSWPHSRTCRSLRDRKSTRLNSSHGSISYAVFCLQKKKKYLYLNKKLYDKLITGKLNHDDKSV